MVCRELGFSDAENATTHSFFGPAETPIQIAQKISIPYTADDVKCNGSEASLSDCIHSTTNDCSLGEAAGVVCKLEDEQQKRRRKRGAAAAISAVAAAAPAVGDLAGSVVNYFEQKAKEKQEYLNERPDPVDLSSSGVELKMRHDKGYKDLGGEFKDGDVDIKIENIPKKTVKEKSGGAAFTYPAGLGPLLMNGCFGTGYKPGDPCYANKRLSTKCLNMMEAANYVGVGFDGTGAYTHASRRKSLIQRICEGKNTYQGEDVPDTMNVFGIYDTSCTGQSFNSLTARSEYQRKQSKMGENKDFLRYAESSQFSMQAEASGGLFKKPSASMESKYHSESNKHAGTSSHTRAHGEANSKNSKSISKVFDFSCRIRRYEIFMDEVKPDQLSEAFLRDYMDLPIRYFDFRNKAPQRFNDFLLRWGTHFIKSASFGGKFTLLRESVKKGEESQSEFQSRMQSSASELFESKSSDVDVSGKMSGGLDIAAGGVSGDASLSVDTAGTQASDSTATANESSSSQENSARTETSFSMDDILVEGGHQRVASILSDKNRSGFKGEFVAWLESIPQYPKGYDFKFGEISDLLDMNFHSLINGDFLPCWNRTDLLDSEDQNGNRIKKYSIDTKDENGDMKKMDRECHFSSIVDFQDKMDKKRLSLKHAITIFARNGGRSFDKLLVPAGPPECENKRDTPEAKQYNDLLDGSSFEVAFDLKEQIGNKIQAEESLLLRFQETDDNDETKTSGSWQVNRELSRSAGQDTKIVEAKENKVFIMGIRFTYYSRGTGNYLKWTTQDCIYNVIRFKNLQNIVCDIRKPTNTTYSFEDITENDDRYDDGDVDWVGAPLATVTTLSLQNKEFLPCNMEWSNTQMLMSDNSCVRFTAASEGPIYFGLSAVPDKFSTWYYFRIATVRTQLI